MFHSNLKMNTKAALLEHYNAVILPQLNELGLRYHQPRMHHLKQDIITSIEAARYLIEQETSSISSLDLDNATEWYPVHFSVSGNLNYYAATEVTAYTSSYKAMQYSLELIHYPSFSEAVQHNSALPTLKAHTAYPACPMRLPETNYSHKHNLSSYDHTSDYVEWYTGVGLDSVGATEWYPVYVDHFTGDICYYTDTWTATPTRAALAMLESYDLTNYPTYREAILHNHAFPSLSPDTALPACPIRPITLPVNADVDSMPPIDLEHVDRYYPVRIADTTIKYYLHGDNWPKSSHRFVTDVLWPALAFRGIENALVYRENSHFLLRPTHILAACSLPY